MYYSNVYSQVHKLNSSYEVSVDLKNKRSFHIGLGHSANYNIIEEKCKNML